MSKVNMITFHIFPTYILILSNFVNFRISPFPSHLHVSLVNPTYYVIIISPTDFMFRINTDSIVVVIFLSFSCIAVILVIVIFLKLMS